MDWNVLGNGTPGKENGLSPPNTQNTNEHTDLGREDGLVVQLRLNPCHQKVDVLGCRHTSGLLELDAVLPLVLKAA